jgi:hypothetical protein
MVTRRSSTGFFLALFFIMGLLAALGINHLQVENHIYGLHTDAIYFIAALFFIILVFLKSGVETAKQTIYMFSIIFFFAFIFLNWKVALLATLLFFVPSLLYQKKLINSYILGVVSIIAAFVSGYKYEYYFLLPLYMPICMLVAQKTTADFKVRFSKNAHDNENLLSLKQQKMRKIHKRGKFAIFLAHLDEIIATLSMLGEDEKEKAVANSMELYGSKSLKLQDSNTMSEALTSIKTRDQNFNPDEFLKFSDKVFKKVLKTWYGQEIEKIEHLASDALFEQLKHQISDQIEAGIKYKCRNLEILDQRIAFVDTNENFDYIVVFFRATTLDSLIDSETNKALIDNIQPRALIEYWTFIRRPGAKTSELNESATDKCPNCGAPIVIGHATKCQTCKTYLRSGEYNWVLTKITQASEWERLNPANIHGWHQLKENDNFFSLQSVEDLASVIFWKIREAEKSSNIKLLSRFVGKDFRFDFNRIKSREINTGSYLKEAFDDASYMENVKLASVRLKAIVTDKTQTRLFLLLIWSGVPVKTDKNGTIEDSVRINCIIRDVYILSRKKGVKSKITNAITSSHCPNCGAGSENGFTNTCKYCDTVLNDENNSWVLQKVVTEKYPEYKKVLASLDKETEPIEFNDEASMSASATEIITVLAQVMIADEKASIEELAMLKKMAHKYAVADKKVNSIVKSLRNGMVYIPTPENGIKAQRLLSCAIEMAITDGKLDENERKLLLSLGKHLGLKEAAINNSIKITLKQKIH